MSWPRLGNPASAPAGRALAAVQRMRRGGTNAGVPAVMASTQSFAIVSDGRAAGGVDHQLGALAAEEEDLPPGEAGADGYAVGAEVLGAADLRPGKVGAVGLVLGDGGVLVGVNVRLVWLPAVCNSDVYKYAHAATQSMTSAEVVSKRGAIRSWLRRSGE